ncbi:hypothetical protein CI109_104699 [Kwoniella shandongensis]|uniref:Uncharacterized protein n=1 Tax=Kwoniella shandongensis TaxID=1734106 RepID=A0A5M6BY95_9TREE|nr:uncharacterized protein CI109_004862 [Kwoniella shandongensis]KAA5526862.1 hypothetical protein CI109_004862 [Kwoniella shandongensis]
MEGSAGTLEIKAAALERNTDSSFLKEEPNIDPDGPTTEKNRIAEEAERPKLDTELSGKDKPPWGIKWRSSSWFITSVVTLGATTDILTYTIVVPVLPYRLQAMNYTNISSLTSWLLFAYSAGILVCTLPVAWFFHKYPYRRNPLVGAILVLQGSLVLFMLAKPYWVMVVSRFLQGAASTIVWSVGFALICENVEEKNIGRQIGFAYSGVAIGTTIAPPIGGALYSALGWHAPFIFCIIICAIDLVLRLFVLEQKDLRKWEAKHAQRLAASHQRVAADEERRSRGLDIGSSDVATRDDSPDTLVAAEVEKKPKTELSPWGVIVALGSSPRGMTAFVVSVVYGLVLGSLEPSLTLRVQSIWHKDADFVGLVYLAAAAPTFISGPVVGAMADKWGAEFIMLPALIMILPWLPLMLLSKSIAGFIVFFAIAEFFLSCAMGPTGLEVTMVARNIDGISEIHQFAAMNIAFAISTAIGTVAGGQMYDHLTNGWAAVIWFCFGVCAFVIPFPFFFTGNKSFYRRLVDRGRKPSDNVEMESGQGTDETVISYNVPPERTRTRDM